MAFTIRRRSYRCQIQDHWLCKGFAYVFGRRDRCACDCHL